MDDEIFASIVAGLEEAIAYQRGELVAGACLTRFERLPDGTVRPEKVTGTAPNHAPGPASGAE